MSKALKQYVTRDIDKKLKKASNFLAVNYQGLDSLETFELRKSLRDGGIKMQVIPNRVALKILAPSLQAGAAGLEAGVKNLFKGPTALLLSKEGKEEQVILAAKVLAQWQKKNKDKL